MGWVEVFAVFVVSHLVGDYLFQTDWQAMHKHGGLAGDPVARRALLAHVTTYTLAFVPALIWLADDLGGNVAWVAALVFVPHLIQDDGRLIKWYMLRVKKCDPAVAPSVAAMVDQTFHMVTLFGLALLTTAV